MPPAAKRSRCVVRILVDPKQARSPYPKSSARMNTIFGGREGSAARLADTKANPKTTQIQSDRLRMFSPKGNSHQRFGATELNIRILILEHKPGPGARLTILRTLPYERSSIDQFSRERFKQSERAVSRTGSSQILFQLNFIKQRII